MVKSFSKIVAMLFVLCIALYSCDTPESIVDEEGAQTEEPADEEKPDGEENTDEENPDENEPVVTPDDGIIKILAIGNSFSQDAVEQYLYELFEAEGIKAVIGNLYIGGCSLEKHWSNASSGAAQYAYRKVEDGNKKETANVTMEYGILDEDWDYISLQQVSGKSGLYETYNPYLPNLIKYVEGLATNTEMKLMLHQTWAYASNSTHADFPNYGNDQIAMYKAIVSAVDRAAVDNGIEIVIPSGTAIQNGRNSYLGDSFNRDGYHLETTYGRYTAACTWFEKISGLDVRENPYSPNLDTQLKKLVQSAAHRAVQNPSVADPMTDFQAPEAEVDDFSALYIDFGSNRASGLPWNNVAVSSLGDGDNIFLKDSEGGYTGVTISGISGFTGMYNGVGTEPDDADLTVGDIKVHKFTCFFYRFHYSFIHRYLIVIIFLEPGIPAIFSIGPCLMENNFRTLIYPFLYIFIQFRKICFVRIVHARERTGLLQTNVIPFFIGQSLRNTHITMVNFLTIKPNFTIIIRSRIFPDIIYMSFQRASTNKKVSYYKFITFCLSQFMQILFYRIL
jgi:hypothetical protein